MFPGYLQDREAGELRIRAGHWSGGKMFVVSPSGFEPETL